MFFYTAFQVLVISLRGLRARFSFVLIFLDTALVLVGGSVALHGPTPQWSELSIVLLVRRAMNRDLHTHYILHQHLQAPIQEEYFDRQQEHHQHKQLFESQSQHQMQYFDLS